MRYGLPYKGSKSRIVDDLLTVMPPAEHFYDLFCGGCAVAHAAMLSGKWGTVHINDINPMMPEAFVKAINGGFDGEDRWISHEDFFRLRDTDPYASICFSFGNDLKSYCYARELEPYKKAMHYAVFFDDWSLFRELCPEICDRCKERVRPVADRTGRRIALANAINACAPGQGNPLYEAKKKHLERLEHLERLQHTSSDYREMRFEPGSVIYCDIPDSGPTVTRPDSTMMPSTTGPKCRSIPYSFHPMKCQGNVSSASGSMPRTRISTQTGLKGLWKGFSCRGHRIIPTNIFYSIWRTFDMDERIERIWLKSCEMRGVSPEDIRSRKRDMVAARHDTWILCADSGISYKRIGREMGFDHVTVLLGVRTCLDDIKFVRGYRKAFNALCDALGMENSKRYG